MLDFNNKLYIKEFQIIEKNNYDLKEYLKYKRDGKLQLNESLRMHIYQMYMYYKINKNKNKFFKIKLLKEISIA